MARFYGIISGQANTEATRIGSAKSGLETQANTWTKGVTTHLSTNHTDQDIIDVMLTTGSDQRNIDVFIGQVWLDNDGVPKLHVPKWAQQHIIFEK